jgi:hypothetical protein
MVLQFKFRSDDVFLLFGWGHYKMVSELREMSKKWRCPACWWLGTLQIGIRAKRDVQEVALPGLLVAGDVSSYVLIFDVAFGLVLC